MAKSTKRRLAMGLQGKKRSRQGEAASESSAPVVDPDNQTLADRKKAMASETPATRSAPKEGQGAEDVPSKASGKRLLTVESEAEIMPKRRRQSETPRATLAVEEEGALSNRLPLPVLRRRFSSRTI